jgi:hypothetical protein
MLPEWNRKKMSLFGQVKQIGDRAKVPCLALLLDAVFVIFLNENDPENFFLVRTNKNSVAPFHYKSIKKDFWKKKF